MDFSLFFLLLLATAVIATLFLAGNRSPRAFNGPCCASVAIMLRFFRDLI